MLGEEKIPVGWRGQELLSLLQTVLPIALPPSEAHASPASPSPLGHFLFQLNLITPKGRVNLFPHP